MLTSATAMPYWRLSGYYFFFFASLGAILPYWGLYLESLRFDPFQIGCLMAMLHGTKLIAPNVWGWLSDRLQRRMPVIQIAGLFAASCFAFILMDLSFWGIAAVMMGFGFFWNAMLPQFEAVTLSYLDADAHGYSRVRLWGSVGFVFAVLWLGWLIPNWSISALPEVILGLLVAIWAISLTVRDPSVRTSQTQSSSIGQILRQPVVLAFMLVCFLVQMSHGPYYVFFSIYLQDVGYPEVQIGQLWALGVVAEIVLFYGMRHVFRRVALQRVLLVSLILTGLRWLLIAWFADQLWWLLLAQVLHAASFGAFHVVAIQIVHHHFRGQNQGRGQALYSSVSFGAGGMVGSLYSGVLWQALGPAWVFGLAAALAVIATWIAWRWAVAVPASDGPLGQSELTPMEPERL